MKLTPEIFEKLKEPTTIYHYTSSMIAIEKILPYSMIMMNHLKNTNDPREYKSIYLTSVGWDDYNDPNDKIRLTMKRLDEIRRNEFQVLSFSCNNNELYHNRALSYISQFNLLGCCKSRMWSQYGESHRGVFLAFNSNALENTLRTQSNKSQNIYNQKINYEQYDIKTKLTLNSNEILKNNIDDYCYSFIEKNKNSIFFLKNPDYQDENEHRIIIRSSSPERIMINIKESLIAVLIGDKFPDGLLPSLKYFCNKLNVECKRVFWDSGRPILLTCNPIDPKLFDVINQKE